jgi:acyl-coenzyme A synthetase/AMP-(fatty) acid ligase
MSLANLIHLTAERRPGHPAIVMDDASTSYLELSAEVDAAAGWLLKQQVQGGEIVALGLPQVPYWQLVFALGALRLGATPAVLGSRPLQEIAALGRPRVLCALGSALARVPELAVMGISPKDFAILRNTRQVRGLPAVDSAAQGAGLVLFGGFVEPRAVRLDGATGQGRLRATAGAHGIDAASAVLCLLEDNPGHWLEVALAVFASGATLAIPRRPATAAALAARVGVDRLIVSPRILGSLLKLGQPLTGLATRRLSLVGGPMLAHTVPAITAHIAAEAQQVGWAGETGVYAQVPASELPQGRGCLGRPLPGVELVARDGQSGAKLAPGTTGLIWARTPWMATAYLDGAQADGPRGLAGGWNATGLLGHAGPAGLWLVTRSLMPRPAPAGSGPAAAPRKPLSRGEMEAALLKLRGLLEVCVLSRPTGEGRSEPVIVYVGDEDGAPAAVSPRVSDLLEGQPFHLVRLPKLPRSPDGVVARSALAKALEPELRIALARRLASAEAPAGGPPP